jgi:hypothetical protein
MSILRTLLLALLCVPAAGAETLMERVLRSYDPVQSLCCEIRKDTENPAGAIRTLSRVYYQRPDRLHVENVSPVKRRIVSDGTTFFSYIEGDPKGFSRPVAKLDREMLLQLRKVPGTAMDHLMRLAGAAARPMDPTEEFPQREGYDAENCFAVLSLDAVGRLARIEVFTAADMKQKTAEYAYSAFKEAAPGVWIPCLHQVTAWTGGVETRETSRIDNLAVNPPIAGALFIAEPFFRGVPFTASFDEIYE